MMFLLRAVFLWISIFGFCGFLKKYMNSAFTPIFTLASIGVLIFVAGLLNVMLVTVWLIVLGGWICLFLCKPWKKDFYTEQKSTFVVFGIFSVLCGLFLLRVYNQIPTHYDSFSHWQTVVRDMIKSDSMPSFKSALITFQGYPTGSAGFIYFICEAVGKYRDDFQLFAQAMLYAAAVTSFIAFIKRFDVISILAAVVGALLCLTAQSNAMDHLLVDTLVSLLSVAVVACLIYYRDQLTTGVLISLPMQLFLVAVKNSGIVMVAMNFVLVMALAIAADYTAKRKVSKLKLVKLGGLTAGIPAVLYYLWMQHVDYAFTAGVTTKHTASLENYKQTLADKSIDQMKAILVAFYRRFVSWNPAWKMLIILAVILLVGWLVKKYLLKKPAKAELFIFLGILGAYFGFMAILAAMYLLSMPYNESIVLAAYSRYENTVLVYMIGSMTIYILSLFSLLPTLKKEGVIKLVVLLIFSYLLTQQTIGLKSLVTQTNAYINSSRQDVEEIKYSASVPEGKSYFVYSNRHQNDSWYHHYMLRYIFWSTNVRLCPPEEFEKQKELISKYDYLIILDYDDQIDNFLYNYDLEQNKQAYAIKGVFE